MLTRTFTVLAVLFGLAILTPSCTSVSTANGTKRLAFINSGAAKEQAKLDAEAKAKAAEDAERAKNRAASGHYLFVDKQRLDAVTPTETKIEIDLTKQRAKVLDRAGNLLIETQISTGTSNHRTPTGNFTVLEKIVDKRSNRYGKWVNPSTGSTISSDGDSYKKPSADAKFVGTQMPYWLRTTWFGIGMHVGYVPDYAASHGCIRVPAHIQPTLYSKVRVGTPVKVHY